MDEGSVSGATEVERLVIEWLEARERGSAVGPEEFVRRHPEFADALRERLLAIELVGAAFADPETPPGRPSGEDSASQDVVARAGARDAHPPSIGEFRIVREIGRGGMGVVYEAEQGSMRRLVALKVLSPAVTSSRKAVLRFQGEARAAGRLHHTNVVPVYGMGEERGIWWYAMELVHGRPLDAVIDDVRRIHGEPGPRRERTPGSSAFDTDPGTRAHYERVAEAFAGVAEGLEFAHQVGVVHRDVKPSNLILDAEGRLRLTDFGLARVEEDGGGVAMTLSGEVLGTPVYMSPEQARGAREGIDARTDVYSLGATLYEALTLRAPFDGGTPGEIFSKIASKDPMPPRRVDARIPRDLSTIVEKAMEKERARRYATAGDMARDLRLYAEGAAIRARRIGPVGRAWRMAQRHRALTSLGAAVAVLTAVGAASSVRAQRAEAARNELQYAALCMQAEEELARGIENGDASGITIGEAPAGRAHSLFDRAIELGPERPEAYVGRALAAHEPIDVRLADLGTARAHGLGEATYDLSRAFLLRAAGRAQESETAERAAAAAQGEPTGEDFYFRARLLMSRGERRAAIDAFTEALRRTRSDGFIRPLALFGRSVAREMELDLLGAIQDLAESGAAGAGARVRLASLWRRARHPGRAEAVFTDILEETRRRGALEAFRELSGACRAYHEHAWTERVCEATAQAYGDDCDVLIEWSGALSGVGRHVDGLAAAERAIALDQTSARAYAAKGRRLINLARHPEALNAFGRALLLSPGLANARSGLADTYLRLGDRDAAVATWDDAVVRSPADPTVRNAFGTFLCDRVHDYVGAVAQLRAAIALAPDETGFRFSLGKALAGCGERAEAAKEFREVAARLREAILQQPDLAHTHRQLGLTLFRLHDVDESEDLDEARTEYRKAVELNPNIIEDQFEYGLVYLADGDIQVCYGWNSAFESLVAGCGRGGAAPPDEASRARRRGEALAWFRDQLASWRRQVESGDAVACLSARTALEHMDSDADFKGVRDEADLARLPEPERTGWREFWAQFSELLARVRG